MEGGLESKRRVAFVGPRGELFLLSFSCHGSGHLHPARLELAWAGVERGLGGATGGRGSMRGAVRPSSPRRAAAGRRPDAWAAMSAVKSGDRRSHRREEARRWALAEQSREEQLASRRSACSFSNPGIFKDSNPRGQTVGAFFFIGI